MSKNVSSLADFNVTLEPRPSYVTEDTNMEATLATLENATYEDPMDAYCRNSYNQTMEDHSSNVFRFVIYGILLTTIGLLGTAGNLISITILSRPKMRSSINCCLIGLTSFDMIVTTTSIVMFGLPEISEYTNTMLWYAEGVYQRVTPFVYPLGLIAQTGSVYLTVTVTMERYVAVCRPLRARSLCTYGRAKIYVIGVAFFSIIYNLPRFWEVSYKKCFYEDTTFITVAPTPLRLNTYYVQIYIMWMYLFFMYLVPFLSLMVFNSFIYKEVRAANHERQRLSRLQRKEIGLAVMLLVVVTVFFLCNVLAFILNVLELAKTINMDNLTVISNLLITVNSSVNFIIYCIFGQKFRKLFLRMFCSRCLPSPVGREGGFADSAIYVNNSIYGHDGHGRHLSNGGATETFRLTSWSGHRHSHLLNPHNDIHRPPSYKTTNTVTDSRFLKRGMANLPEYDQLQQPSQCFD